MRSPTSLTTETVPSIYQPVPGAFSRTRRFASLRKTRAYGHFRKAKLALWYRIQDVLIFFDIEQRLVTEDRRIFETIVLPSLRDEPSYKHVLFIGSHWYTRWYRAFFNEDTYWTLDINPQRKRFGARKHIVDSMENIERHFAADSLDLIICNGVFGWGLNEKAAVERAFHACHCCLRQGGLFVLGWHDLPDRRPFPPGETKSLKLFRPAILEPVGAPRIVANDEYRYVCDFFVK